MWAIQTYEGHCNIEGASKHMRGDQIYGVSKHTGDIQTYAGGCFMLMLVLQS